MANNYNEILAVVNKGNQMGLSNTIKRNNGIPLDFSSVQETYEAALDYAQNNPLAYIGQPIAVGDTLYVVATAENGYLKAVGTKPTGDGKSISVSDSGVVSMYGFAAAGDATLPRKNSDGTISWITLADIAGSTDTNTKTVVAAADGSDITVNYTYDEETDTRTYSLDVQFPAIPEYSVIKEVGENSVTYKVTKDSTAVGEAIVVPNAYDDTAVKSRLETLESIDHSTYAKAADLITATNRLNVITGEDTVDGSIKKALKDAKAYADGLASNYETSGAAGTAESNAKAYTDEEIAGLDLTFTDNKIQLANKSGSIVAEFDASVFVRDSFLNDVKYEDGKIKFTWTMGDGSAKTDEVDVADFVPVYTVATGSGLTLTNNEFGVDTTIIATKASVDAAQKTVDDYITAHAGDYTNATIDTAISNAVAALNIADYAKTADVVSNETFDAFQEANTAAISKAVSDQAAIDDGKYATKTNLEETDNRFADYTTTEDLTALLDGKVGTAVLDDYYKKTETYSADRIDELLTAISGETSETVASVKSQLDTYKTSTNEAITAIQEKNSAQDDAITANANAIDAINATDTGLLAQAKTYADGIKTNIDTAYKAADTALGGRIDNVLALINNEDTGLQAQITALDGKVTTAESEITTLKTTVSGHTTTIGTHTTAIGNLEAEDTRLAGLIADNTAKFDGYYTKTAVDGLIEGVEAKITDLGISDYAKTTEVAAAIKVETDRALAAEKVNSDAIAVLNGADAGKSVRAIAGEEINALIKAADPEDGKTIENIANLVKYVDENAGEIAALITAVAENKAALGINTEAIAANTSAITALNSSVAANEVKESTEISVTNIAGENTTGIQLSIKEVNVNKLVQSATDILVLNGGDAQVKPAESAE